MDNVKNVDAGIRLVLEEIRDLRREIAEDRRQSDLERRQSDLERRKADEAWREERRRADERFERMFQKVTVDSAKRERELSRALVVIGNVGRQILKRLDTGFKDLSHKLDRSARRSPGNGHGNGHRGNGHK